MATKNGIEDGIRTRVFAAFAVLTVAAVVLSVVGIDQSIPPRIYLFGFLGATVYVFTSLAEAFDEEGRYALEIASKGIAAFPLAAGVYLLAFAFPITDGGASGQPASRIVSGLVFLAGAYVSLTLQALGGLAHRMLGVARDEEEEGGTDERENARVSEREDAGGDGREEGGGGGREDTGGDEREDTGGDGREDGGADEREGTGPDEGDVDGPGRGGDTEEPDERSEDAGPDAPPPDEGTRDGAD